MQNFDYSIPTRIHFGKGKIVSLGAEVFSLGSRVLLVYGGGSIKKTGLYDTVLQILNGNQAHVAELSGVQPNPRIESVREGAAICKEQKIEVVLAVGGGSVIDCAKVIAAGALYEGDAWDLVTNPDNIKAALPVVSVLTLAATGSEMDAFAVISNLQTNEKLGTGSDLLKPRASILDPEYTYSVSKKQTAAGTADIMSHIFENYFNHEKGAYIQARFCESLLRTCIQYGKIALETPNDYEARANLMWASSLAINGMCSYGAPVEWEVHPMEHELSAFYDITHGEGLAILTPNWMQYTLSEKTVFKFVEYGVNVWGIDSALEPFAIAKQAIQKTREFFDSLGLPSTLRQVGIDESKLDVMAKKAVGDGITDGFIPLYAKDVKKIYQMSL